MALNKAQKQFILTTARKKGNCLNELYLDAIESINRQIDKWEDLSQPAKDEYKRLNMSCVYMHDMVVDSLVLALYDSVANGNVPYTNYEGYPK